MVQQAAATAAGGLAAKYKTLAEKTKGQSDVRPMHIMDWGLAKVGKSHLGCDGQTHAVYAAKKEAADAFGATAVKGELLVPRKYLKVAHANFDRAAHTVYDNLAPEQKELLLPCDLYEAEDGGPLVGESVSRQQVERYEEFFKYAKDEWGAQLFHLDGGKVGWNLVRNFTLPEPTPDKTGELRIPPRAYDKANDRMRLSIMQPLYNSGMHTAVTLEASEVWDSTNKKREDAMEIGGVALKQEGWGQTNHYVDVGIRLRFKETANGSRLVTTREGVITMAGVDNQQLINTIVPDAKLTFRGIYMLIRRRPLLLPEDYAVFEGLQPSHPEGFIFE